MQKGHTGKTFPRSGKGRTRKVRETTKIKVVTLLSAIDYKVVWDRSITPSDKVRKALREKFMAMRRTDQKAS